VNGDRAMRAKCGYVPAIMLLGLATFSSFPAKADFSKRVCGGEDQANGCPVSKDIMLGCNPTPQQLIAAACTVYQPDGTTSVYPARIERQGSHSGGSCGYAWYVVTCITSGQ
jgi:hypothetical protein